MTCCTSRQGIAVLCAGCRPLLEICARHVKLKVLASFSVCCYLIFVHLIVHACRTSSMGICSAVHWHVMAVAITILQKQLIKSATILIYRAWMQDITRGHCSAVWSNADCQHLSGHIQCFYSAAHCRTAAHHPVQASCLIFHYRVQSL